MKTVTLGEEALAYLSDLLDSDDSPDNAQSWGHTSAAWEEARMAVREASR